eukprot:EG_transcript_11977
MPSVTVTLNEVLSKPRQSEAKGQKSILAIVERNADVFIQHFGLEALEVDFAAHAFTVAGRDPAQVSAARARLVHMLREPLFVLRINPKVIVGMRLLNETKKQFSLETGCWMHFAWATHTIGCYGLNGAAAGRYVHDVLSTVERCVAACASGVPPAADCPIVMEETYDRRLKPLIKKYVNVIEARTNAKLAVQSDDAETRHITVQFYGKTANIAQARHMIVSELEAMQLRELGLQVTGKSPEALKQLLAESRDPKMTGGLCPIVLSYATVEGEAPAPQMLLVPVRVGPSRSLPCPRRARCPSAAPLGPPAPAEPAGAPLPQQLSIPASCSAVSSHSGSLGPDGPSPSPSAEFPAGAADTLPARCQTASVADLHRLRRAPPSGVRPAASADCCRRPPAVVTPSGPRSWSHDDLMRALAALRRSETSRTVSVHHPFAAAEHLGGDVQARDVEQDMARLLQ